MVYLLLLLNFTSFVSNPDTWVYQIEDAKTIASEESKQILMVFSGSDWCAPCKKLKKTILISEEFSKFENDNLVVLYLDFPAKKKNRLSKEQTKHNEDLADKFNSSGSFPKIILLDKNAIKIKDIPFEGQSPSQFISLLKK